MVQRIGILGGTFDPVHDGHVALAHLATERLGLDRLLVIPAHRSPHKDAPPAAPAADRLALLRIAFAGAARIVVDDREINRPPPSYTIDTVTDILRENPGAAITLLVGFDALAALPRWKDAARLAEICRIATFRRPGAHAGVPDAVRRDLPHVRIEVIEAPLIDASATEIRARARKGLPLTGWVPAAVADAIRARGLYR